MEVDVYSEFEEIITPESPLPSVAVFLIDISVIKETGFDGFEEA